MKIMKVKDDYNMNYPEVRIKNAWLLYDAASVHLHELWAKKDEHLATKDEVDTYVSAYKKAWEPYQDKVIRGMSDGMGLEFRQNIIDVGIAPWFIAFSDPMVIGITYMPDRFVEVLTHEIIHRLLTDNTQTAYDTPYADHWKKLFGEEHSFNVLIHIPVHAILQYVFDDVLNEPQRTKNDRAKCSKWPDYDAAWQYVEKHGYQTIIAQLKENYAELAEKSATIKS